MCAPKNLRATSWWDEHKSNKNRLVSIFHISRDIWLKECPRNSLKMCKCFLGKFQCVVINFSNEFILMIPGSHGNCYCVYVFDFFMHLPRTWVLPDKSIQVSCLIFEYFDWKPNKISAVRVHRILSDTSFTWFAKYSPVIITWAWCKWSHHFKLQLFCCHFLPSTDPPTFCTEEDESLFTKTTKSTYIGTWIVILSCPVQFLNWWKSTIFCFQLTLTHINSMHCTVST